MTAVVVRRGAGFLVILGRLLRLFELLDVLGRFLVESLQAGLAAQFDLPALVREDVGLAHVAVELLAGDDARFERIQLGFLGFPFTESDRDQRGECQCTTGAENDVAEFTDIFHGLLCIQRFVLMAATLAAVHHGLHRNFQNPSAILRTGLHSQRRLAVRHADTWITPSAFSAGCFAAREAKV